MVDEVELSEQCATCGEYLVRQDMMQGSDYYRSRKFCYGCGMASEWQTKMVNEPGGARSEIDERQRAAKGRGQ
jgi:hypothetical protein